MTKLKKTDIAKPIKKSLTFVKLISSNHSLVSTNSPDNQHRAVKNLKFRKL